MNHSIIIFAILSTFLNNLRIQFILNALFRCLLHLFPLPDPVNSTLPFEPFPFKTSHFSLFLCKQLLQPFIYTLHDNPPARLNSSKIITIKTCLYTLFWTNLCILLHLNYSTVSSPSAA